MPKFKVQKSSSSMLSTTQAAQEAGVDPKTILNWIKRGILPARKKGFGPTSSWLIDRATFQRVLAKRDSMGEQK